jgi:hypothetical protein
MATTPNMSLVLPDSGSTVGPTYAQLLTNLGGAFYTLDSHNHSPSSGVRVPTAGININADLACTGYSLTGLVATKYTLQSSDPSGLCTVYFKGSDLYCTDNSGNHIQMTLSGAVNTGASGSISGMTGGASAAYSSITKTFTWNQASNQRAHMDCASVVIHAGAAAGENGITLKSVNSLAGSYNITLPTAVPGTGFSVMVGDTSATLTWSTLADGTTLENTGSAIRIKDLGVSTAKIADAAVTQAKLAAKTVQTAAVATGSLTSGTLADITGATVTFTSTGRPALMTFVGDATDSFSQGNQVTTSTAGTVSWTVALLVAGVQVASGSNTMVNGAGGTATYACPLQSALFTPSAGSPVVKLQYKITGGGTPSIVFNNMKFSVVEL